MSQRIFILARSPALSQLLSDGKPLAQTDLIVKNYGNYSTAAMMVGWAVGGFYFGIVGDKWGRAKTLSASILVYSVFTGLSGLSMRGWDFCMWRFLMGCGIGGAFATAATLIAETMPTHSRAFALGMFQALSAAGNIFASFVAWKIFLPEGYYWGIAGCRLLFIVGLLPSLLVVFILKTIHEPESWLAARALAKDKLQKQMGDISDMFVHPKWRRHTMVGVGLGVAGVVGLWGVGFWSPELINVALIPKGTTPDAALMKHIGGVKALGTLLQDVGAFFGMFAFTILATRFGRKISFGLFFAVAFLVVSGVFLGLRAEWQVYALLPLVGFVTLSVFGGYSMYFPEIYPTRLRSSGTAFCYNVARVVTAVIILGSGALVSFLREQGVGEVFRWGAVILCGFYVVGMISLIWAPETKDKPLPEDTPSPSSGFPVIGGSASPNR
jgi:MFS family permease